MPPVNTTAIKFAFALDGLIRSRVKGHGGEEFARKCINEMGESLDGLFRTAYVKNHSEEQNSDWHYEDPPKHGYYIAVWRSSGGINVSELWFNPDSSNSKWWFTRGRSQKSESAPVICWMPMPEPPEIFEFET